MADAHLRIYSVLYYPLQDNYYHFQLRYLNIKHSWCNRLLVHPPIVTFQLCHLGIGRVIQSPPFDGKFYLKHPWILLAWNLCWESNQRIITCTCDKDLYFYWIPILSRHQNLPWVIFTKSTSKLLFTLLYMQTHSSWVHWVILILLLLLPFQSQTLCPLLSKISPALDVKVFITYAAWKYNSNNLPGNSTWVCNIWWWWCCVALIHQYCLSSELPFHIDF